MTNFQFTSVDLVTNVVFRTDYIGPDFASGNFTICDILGINTDAEAALFASWQKIKYTIGDLKVFAAANGLSIKAIKIGAPGAAAGTELGDGPKLNIPATLTTTVVSATRIDVAWTAGVGNPSGVTYVLDRATNAGFTTGVALAIYSNTGLAFSNTGLTTATHYYYRLRATKTGYVLSSYKLDDDTTS